jgi:maltooligosyltrehalose trehalohydrolase
MKPGIKITEDQRCIFSVWAPEKEEMILHIVHPFEQEVIMNKVDFGYFSTEVEKAGDGCRYYYRPDGKTDTPDPASHYQPEGVHGPSQVVDHGLFRWKDSKWTGIPLKDLIIYEVHIGTFTSEGTFEAVIRRLEEISETGMNAIELMPVSQFPGSRNWGYDGVFPFSVQNTYGGPEGLKKLVNECHRKGIAVILDIVYNHLGPEGNCFSMYGPYFTDKYKVPWGDAINLDEAWSDGVRDYYASNPGHWLENYHIDGVRVDAIHMNFDSSAEHFWQYTRKKIGESEDKTGRRFLMIAECDFNSPHVIKPPELGGYDFDAVWLDDFHHALYVLLDEKGKTRYEDFGTIEQLSKAYKEGFVHSGEYVKFRKKKHGASSAGISGDKFVVFNQNHDQIGNRVLGERLSTLVGFEQLKVASAAMLMSPYIPMFFMGEEYGDNSPFFYFVSHTDPELVRQVREGRKKEFEAYKWDVDPPDPQNESTFNRSKINWNKRFRGNHKILLEWNKALINLRKSEPALINTDKNGITVYITGKKTFTLLRRSKDEKEAIACFFNLSGKDSYFFMPSLEGSWTKLLNSADSRWTDVNEPDSSTPAEQAQSDSLKAPAWSVLIYSFTKSNRQ